MTNGQVHRCVSSLPHTSARLHNSRGLRTCGGMKLNVVCDPGVAVPVSVRAAAPSLANLGVHMQRAY